ncbi:MAG: LptE family protein [Acidobacteriota bacterium]|nr:LptE family protein [Acidobacteriota bacterium]MDQ7087255.1 LptE family protein [Acidobacteriota bacterium]
MVRSPLTIRPSRLVTGLCLALAAVGCGYHLAGRSTGASFIPPTVKTLGIPTFANTTDRPEIEQRITEALVDEFLRRSRLEAVPDARGADVLLEGEISSFKTDPVTFTESGRFDRVEVTITARVRLVQTSPEKVLWSQNHFVFREQYDVPETPLTEFDREIVAIEEISRGFARSVTTSILEGF